MKWFSVMLAFVAGAVLPLQAGINSQLKGYAGSAVVSAFISFLVGTMALFALAFGLRLPWPSLSVLAQAPWWAWTGGLMGAVLVYLAMVLAESLGAAVMVALIITGQMVVSVLSGMRGIPSIRPGSSGPCCSWPACS
jgi:transporter family-2 protein